MKRKEKHMGRPRTFPVEIYITEEEEGTENEFKKMQEEGATERKRRTRWWQALSAQERGQRIAQSTDRIVFYHFAKNIEA